MTHHSKKESKKSKYDLEDLEQRYYQELKNGILNVKISNSTYRCPYCPDRSKTDYSLKELLRHASRISRESKSRCLKEKAKHSALEIYIERYLKVKDRSQPAPNVDYKRRYLNVTDRSKPGHGYGHDQLFVVPWMGILANIKTTLDDNRHVGESGTKLRNELKEEGFNPVKVHPLWSREGHSGFAVVEFKKDWAGFEDAMSFEKSFEVKHCGKRDYYVEKNRGDKLFGWVARKDDYESKGPVGYYLQKKGDLKTVSEQQAEFERKNEKLVSNLADTLGTKKQCLKEMASKYIESSVAMNKLMAQKDEMVEHYNEEIRKRQEEEHDCFEKMISEHNEETLRLDVQRKELELQEIMLRQREAQNDSEIRRLYHEKKKNEMATLERRKADKEMLQLAEEHKKQKEEFRKKIIGLQKQLDAKQAVELEVECMSRALKMMKHMGEDVGMEKKVAEMEENLKEKIEELEDIEALNQALVVKERRCNDELQEARTELINGLESLHEDYATPHNATIGVRRMGDLDSKPFQAAVERKYASEDVEEKALELCSLWEDNLRDPNWHPFKVILDEKGKEKEIIDEEDEKVKHLRNECGDEVYDAVITALKELNEYNPSGRYPVKELWNNKQGKKASLKEGLIYVLRQWKTYKRRKN